MAKDVQPTVLQHRVICKDQEDGSPFRDIRSIGKILSINLIFERRDGFRGRYARNADNTICDNKSPQF